MKAYYCINKRDVEFLYVPFALISYLPTISKDPVHIWDENILSKLTLDIKEGRLSKRNLEKKGWQIEEIDIPYRMVELFNDFCFRKKSDKKITNKANRIFNLARRLIDYEYEGSLSSSSDNHTPHAYKDSYDGMYDQEDYEQDWWKRGEEWEEGWDL
ncbi:Uncharacterised protein [uncultured archaeon]|nr:Uncharacterised protein [uncultured archaeon]